MLLNEFDIQGFSIINSNRCNIDTMKFVFEQLFKNKNYILKDIIVITDSMNYKKGDVLLVFDDELGRECRCVYTDKNKERIIHMLEEDVYYVVPEYMYDVLKSTTKRDDLLNILKEIVNNKDNNSKVDEFWVAVCDCLYTKYIYESDDNKKKIELQNSLEHAIDSYCLFAKSKTFNTKTINKEDISFCINLN